MVNTDNGRTLGFKGDHIVKYADMVVGGLGMTMAMKVIEGVGGSIGTPFIIFQNNACLYPIRRMLDSVPSVCYHYANKGFMQGFMTSECLT